MQIRNRCYRLFAGPARAILRSVMLSALLVALPGCALFFGSDISDRFQIGDQLDFGFPGWQPPEFNGELVQQISGGSTDRQFSLQTQVSVNQQRVKIVGVDALGRRGFDVSWGGAGVSISSAPWLPSQLDPRQILAHLVMVYWPDPVVQAAVGGIGNLAAGQVSTVFLDTGNQRRIIGNQTTGIIIEYANERQRAWNGTTRISHSDFGYELVIRSVEMRR
ncbi:MAG: DUF3261 domain-containing protein [Immundisolibacteraceae bacterium]|nr:DUF3261 domain-containing protein [Immundisolibacteraceae bacterium]